jgi:hypothetical protein
MLRLFEDASMKRKQLELHGSRRLFFPSRFNLQRWTTRVTPSKTRHPQRDIPEQIQEKTPIIRSCKKLRLIMFPTRGKPHRGKRSLTHFGAHPDHPFSIPRLDSSCPPPEKSYQCDSVDPQDALPICCCCCGARPHHSGRELLY